MRDATPRNILTWPHKVAGSLISSQFVVPGDPVAKQRPRATVNSSGQIRNYSPQTTKDAEETVRACFLGSKRRLFEDDSTRFGVRLFFFKRNRIRTDLDNLAKLVMDALNKLAWNDDSQVDEIVLRRGYDKENPRTEALIYKLPFG